MGWSMVGGFCDQRWYHSPAISTGPSLPQKATKYFHTQTDHGEYQVSAVQQQR